MLPRYLERDILIAKSYPFNPSIHSSICWSIQPIIHPTNQSINILQRKTRTKKERTQPSQVCLASSATATKERNPHTTRHVTTYWTRHDRYAPPSKYVHATFTPSWSPQAQDACRRQGQTAVWSPSRLQSAQHTLPHSQTRLPTPTLSPRA